MNSSNGETPERPPLNVAITAHLNGCGVCQANLKRKPVPNLGGSPTLCSELLDIHRIYAEWEGEVNNIVARDEYGNSAPRSGGEL